MTKKMIRIGLAIASAATLHSSVVGAAGKPGSSDTKLTMTARDAAGDGVSSDGGAYTSGADNVRVVLVANENGNFVFDTNDNTKISGPRRLRLNFAGQQGEIPLPFSTAQPLNVDVFLGTLAGGLADFGDLRAMLINDTLTRRGPITWTDGTRQFALRWNGETDGTHTAGLLQFTCTADNGSSCSAWIVVPTSPIAVLDSVPTKGPSTKTVYGYFSMPFELYLTRQP
jgi:hypothetical protein